MIADDSRSSDKPCYLFLSQYEVGLIIRKTTSGMHFPINVVLINVKTKQVFGNSIFGDIFHSPAFREDCVLLKTVSGEVSFDESEIIHIFNILGHMSLDYLFRNLADQSKLLRHHISPALIDSNNWCRVRAVKGKTDKPGLTPCYLLICLFHMIK
jgi:hypothetical protein